MRNKTNFSLAGEIKRTYEEILRKLGIDIIGEENTPKCHSVTFPFQNEGLKIKNLLEVRAILPNLHILRYKQGFYYCIFTRKEEVYKGFTYNSISD